MTGIYPLDILKNLKLFEGHIMSRVDKLRQSGAEFNWVECQRDEFGIPRTSFVSDPNIPTSLAPAQPHKGFKITPSKRDLPSSQNWRATSFIGKVVSFFEHTLFFLEKFWPGRPPEVDQRLMASMHGSRIAAQCPGMQQASTNQILKFMIRFFKTHKEFSPPNDLLRSFQKCADWASKLDKIANYHDYTTRAKHLDLLSKGISKEIIELKTGQRCLIPGGWREDNQVHAAFYEVTKSEAGTYTLKIHSRDQLVNQQSQIMVAGKIKMVPSTVFSNLKAEEVADTTWLHALLRLQMPSGEKQLHFEKNSSDDRNYFSEAFGSILGERCEGEVAPNIASLKGLLERFKDRLEKSSTAIETYRSCTEGNAVHNNVWMLTELAKAEQTGNVEAKRRNKLLLKIHTTFDFYKHVRKDLAHNQTNQVLLEEGIKRISNLASLMHADKQLTDAEVAKINKECQAIALTIEKARSPEFKKSNNNPFRLTGRLRSHPFNATKATIKPFDAAKLDFTSVEKIKSSRSETQVETEILELKIKSSKLTCPDASCASTIASALQNFRTECEDLARRGEEYQLQSGITELFYSLKLDIIEQKGVSVTSFWRSLNDSDLEVCCKELGELSKLLMDSSEKTQCKDPEKLGLLIKIGLIQEGLARINYSQSKMPDNVRLTFWSYAYHFLNGDTFWGNDYKPNTLRKFTQQETDLFYQLNQYIKNNSPLTCYSDDGWHISIDEISNKGKVDEVRYIQKPSLLRKEAMTPMLTSIEEQIKLYQKNCQLKFLDSKKVSYSDVEKSAVDWSKPFQYRCMRALAYNGKLGERSETCKKKWDLCNLAKTEENIRDNPEQVFREYQKTLDYKQKDELSDLPPLSKQDLADILILAGKNSFWEMLGLIKHKPYLLDIPDVRTLIEHVNFNGQDLSRQISKNDIPLIVQQLSQQIEIFKNQGNIARTLFLINLTYTISNNVSSPEIANLLTFPDFTPLLREWCYASLDLKKPEYAQRHILWKTLLLSLENKEELTGKQVVEFLEGLAILKTSSAEVYDFDPIQEVRLNKLKEKWKNPIREFLANPQASSLLQHTLDSICTLTQNPLPDGTWQGTFPAYTAGSFEIDILEGLMTNKDGGWSTRSIPPLVRKNKDVSTALSLENLDKFSTRFTRKGNESLYNFLDIKGKPTAILSSEKENLVYKEVEIAAKGKKETLWLQYVSKDALFPRVGKKEQEYHTNDVKRLFIILCVNLFRQSRRDRAPKLPEFLDLPNYRFWVDSKNPSRTFVLDEDGTLLFRVNFKRKYGKQFISSVIDLREEGIAKKKTVGELTDKMHPVWQELLHLDTPGNIMVWEEGRRIEKVELTRYRLNFVEKDGKPVCTDSRLKDWILIQGPSAELVRKGIQSAVVLRHPTIASQYRVIVPNKEVVQNKSNFKLSYRVLYELIKGVLFGHRVVSKTKDPIAKSWTLKSHPSNQEFWIYDVDQASLAYSEITGTSIAPYTYLAFLSLISHQPEKSLEFLQRINKFPGQIGREDFDGLKKYVDCGLNHPDAIALRLHAALAGRKKTSGEEKKYFEEAILSLYKQYANFGGKISGVLRIDPVTEAACLINLEGSDYYNANAALLTNRTEKRVMKVGQFHGSFFESRQACKKNLSDFTEKLNSQLSANTPTKYDFATKNLQQLGVKFAEIYSIVSASSLSSKDFKEVEATLLSLPQESWGSNPSDQKEKKEEFLPVLQNYLIRVLDIRQKNSSLIFPAFPKLVPLPEDHNDGSNYEEKHRINEQNNKTLGDFLQELEKLIVDEEKLHPNAKLADPILIDPEFDHEKARKDLEALLKNYLEKNPDMFIDEFAIDELEHFMKEVKPQSLNIKLDPTIGHALATKEELAPIFNISKVQEIFPETDFSDLKQSSKASLKLAAETLEAEITLAKNIRAQKKTMDFVKGEASRVALEKLLSDKKKAYTLKQEQMHQEILKLIQEKTSPAYLVQQKAKLKKVVELETLLKHFLQNDLRSLEADLPQGTDFNKIEEALGNYLLASTDLQRLDSALEEVKLLSPEKDGATPMSITNIYQLLLNERQYNPNENPHLLIFEYFTGYLLREGQLKMVQGLLEKPNCFKQAPTGVGKTTVILVLLALMMADGKNLVSVNFPKHLFKDNLNDLQKKLGRIFERNVYALEFNMSTPTVVHDSKGHASSLFKKMYHDLLKVSLSKGVVATTLESQQALEQKWIYLMNQLAQLAPHEVDPLDEEHLVYLTRILDLKRKQEYTIFDEMDKALSEREERHLRFGTGKPVPEFMWKTTLDLYDLLLKDPDLGLQRNIQGEVLDEKARAKIILRIAEKTADDWIIKTGLSDALKSDFVNYFMGENEDLLPQIQHLSPEDKDKIALLKDQFFTFLPLTLSKTCNVRYIRSKDNVHTVPCLAGDIPRESAEFEQILERLNYTIQDHYQVGEKEAFIRQWIKDKKQAAETAVVNEVYATVDETPDAKVFEQYFPGRKLSLILDGHIPELIDEINSDPKRIRSFLELSLQKMEIYSEKISCDGHNLISMFKTACGASATLGATLAMPRVIDTKDASEKGATGKMALSLLMKNKNPDGTLPKMMHYDPEHPEKLIPQTMEQDSNFQIMIDAVAALHGVPFGMPSQQLLDHQPKNGPIQGITIGFEGSCQKVHTRKGIVLPEVAGYKPAQLGGFFDEAGSRGSDFKMARGRALITAHSRQEFEAVLQAAGRLRLDDQEIGYTTPQSDPTLDALDLLKRSLENSVDKNADEIFRGKKHELRNMVRTEMIKTLLETFNNQGVFAMVDQFQDTYKEHNILITEDKTDLSVPGTYFALHHKINKINRDPVQELESVRQKSQGIAKTAGLKSAEEQLSELQYPAEVITNLPDKVASIATPLTGQDVEVETQVEVETELDINSSPKSEVTNYRPWVPSYSEEFCIHNLNSVNSAYSPLLGATENFIPLGRESQGLSKQWHRKAHDSAQNPVRYIQVNTQAGEIKGVLLIDTLEFSEMKTQKHSSYGLYDKHGGKIFGWSSLMGYSYYDLRLNKFVLGPLSQSHAALHQSKEWHELLAQVRFFDGQFDRYKPEEIDALKAWLAKQDPIEMEKYFKNTILNHRPEDRQKYPYSPLCKIFAELKGKDKKKK